MARADLFGNEADWLNHTLATGDRACPEAVLPVPCGQVKQLGTGLLRFEPERSGPGDPALVLSAGIHGNETAPVELLNRLVNSILDGQITVTIPLLLILGNPPAMVAGSRFVEHNLNRLFCGAWRDYPQGYESRRAAQLEAECRAFRNHHPGPLRHYDLHTAIRPSRREKFALYPFVEGREIPQAELDFLTEAGIGTVLLQHKAGTTFSSFSSAHLAAESFTLELGKVHPFGHNNAATVADLEAALARMCRNAPAPRHGPERQPDTFTVVHEIINTGDQFRFHIADDVANFTEYPPGTLIWEDDQGEYRVGAQPEAIVFPNRDVPVGHRVGLMVRRR